MRIKSKGVIEHFIKLSNIYFERSEVSRGSAFKNSAESIKNNYPEYLPEDISDLQKLKGFGGSSYKEVLDFLEDEKTPRIIELENYKKPEKSEDSISKLKSILKRD